MTGDCAVFLLDASAGINELSWEIREFMVELASGVICASRILTFGFTLRRASMVDAISSRVPVMLWFCSMSFDPEWSSTMSGTFADAHATVLDRIWSAVRPGWPSLFQSYAGFGGVE